MKKYAFLLFILAGLVFACTDKDDNVEAVNIRIKNATNLKFSSVEVTSEGIVYDNVEADGYSEYQEYQLGYAYDTIVIVTDSTEYRILPPDSIGVTPLPIGFYTYEITLDAEQKAHQEFVLDY